MQLGSYPFDKETGTQIYENHALKEQMDYWLSLKYGAEVKSSEEEYKLITSDKHDKENPRYQNMSSYGGGQDGWSITYTPNYKAFLEVAELVIMKTGIDSYHSLMTKKKMKDVPIA